MSGLLRGRAAPVLGRIASISRSSSSGSEVKKREDISKEIKEQEAIPEAVTHTGQAFEVDDYRRARFLGGKKKLVNKSWAIDLIAKDPVVVCTQRVVNSDSGGALGHPKVFINLDPPGIHTCGYSGRKFIHKKYYDEKVHGPSITFEEYEEQTKSAPKHYPC